MQGTETSPIENKDARTPTGSFVAVSVEDSGGGGGGGGLATTDTESNYGAECALVLAATARPPVG